jgi:hypothetical protein
MLRIKRSRKVPHAARRIHPLVQDSQDEDVVAFDAEIDEMVLGLDPANDCTEFGRPSRLPGAEQGISDRSQPGGIKIGLLAPPAIVGIGPDMREIASAWPGKPQAARD